jgi:hypothetical protein
VVEELLGPSLFENHPRLKVSEMVSDPSRQAQVVGHHQDGEMAGTADFAQGGGKAVGGRTVKGAGRLVEQQHLGTG